MVGKPTESYDGMEPQPDAVASQLIEPAPFPYPVSAAAEPQPSEALNGGGGDLALAGIAPPTAASETDASAASIMHNMSWVSPFPRSIAPLLSPPPTPEALTLPHCAQAVPADPSHSGGSSPCAHTRLPDPHDRPTYPVPPRPVSRTPRLALPTVPSRGPKALPLHRSTPSQPAPPSQATPARRTLLMPRVCLASPPQPALPALLAIPWSVRTTSWLITQS